MSGQEAIWHVGINNDQNGPLTKGQVFELLKDGLLTGSNLIWRPGFPDWKTISDVSDFWQPPKLPPSAGDAVQPPPPATAVEAWAAPVEGRSVTTRFKDLVAFYVLMSLISY